MKKVLHYLDQVEKAVCVVSITAMLIILTFQVISRYLLKQSNIWTEELGRYLYIWLVFVGTSYAEKEFIHIKIDVLGKVFPKKFRPVAALIGEIILFVFSIFLVWISFSYLQNILARGQFSQALKISMGFPYAAIPVGFALLAIRVLINIVTKRYVPAEDYVDLGDVDASMLHSVDEELDAEQDKEVQ